jgi:hypothetical protein
MPRHESMHSAVWVRDACLASSLRHTPGPITLEALARERGPGAVYGPSLEAREATLPGAVAHRRGAGRAIGKPPATRDGSTRCCSTSGKLTGNRSAPSN